MPSSDPRNSLVGDYRSYYFGACECGLPAYRMFNYGRAHWYYCDDCKTRWCVGENLFSGWRDESEEDWERNRERFEDYRTIAGDRPKWVDREEERERVIGEAESYLSQDYPF